GAEAAAWAAIAAAAAGIAATEAAGAAVGAAAHAGPVYRPALDSVDGLLDEQGIDPLDRHNFDSLRRVLGGLVELLDEIHQLFLHHFGTGCHQLIGTVIDADGQGHRRRRGVTAAAEASAAAAAKAAATDAEARVAADYRVRRGGIHVIAIHVSDHV